MIIKNTDTVDKTYSGQTVSASGQYAVQAADGRRFSDAENLVIDITSGDTVINDGVDDLSIIDGIALLMGSYPVKSGLLAGTDLGEIGRVSDQLKVTDKGNPSANHGIPVFSSKLRYEKDTTGLTLTTSYQTAFTYSGSGKLVGMILDFDKTNIQVKVTLDSTEVIFECTSNEIDDVQSSGARKGAGIVGLAWDTSGSKYVFEPPYPIVYDSAVLIEAKQVSGNGNLSRSIVILTKES